MNRRKLLTVGAALIGQSALPRIAGAQAGNIPVRIGWQPGFAARCYMITDIQKRGGLKRSVLPDADAPLLLQDEQPPGSIARALDVGRHPQTARYPHCADLRPGLTGERSGTH